MFKIITRFPTSGELRISRRARLDLTTREVEADGARPSTKVPTRPAFRWDRADVVPGEHSLALRDPPRSVTSDRAQS